MRNNRFTLFLLCLATTMVCKAQDRNTIQQYVETYRELAIAEMQRSGVPASITLAQGIHETTAGTSPLVLKSNNHFGIKCKSNWTGERVSHTDDAPNECFRKYADPADSYRDHSDFLRNGARYASLFTLDPLDYKGWAHGLKKAGYATNPRYPQVIIKLVEEYDLQDYTLIAMGKMQPREDMIAGNSTDKKESEMKVINTVEQERNTPQLTEIPPARRYPAGEFKINATRVIYAKAGTSLLAIAQQYDVPLKRLYEFNEMGEAEMLTEDRLIYLQRKRKAGETDYHVVAEGETLVSIARDEAIRLESLLEHNHLQAGMEPAAGEQLYLRKKAPGMPKLARGGVGARE